MACARASADVPVALSPPAASPAVAAKKGGGVSLMSTALLGACIMLVVYRLNALEKRVESLERGRIAARRESERAPGLLRPVPMHGQRPKRGAAPSPARSALSAASEADDDASSDGDDHPAGDGASQAERRLQDSPGARANAPAPTDAEGQASEDEAPPEGQFARDGETGGGGSGTHGSHSEA